MMWRIITQLSYPRLPSSPKALLQAASLHGGCMVISGAEKRRTYLLRQIHNKEDYLYSIPGFQEEEYLSLEEVKNDKNFTQVTDMTVLDNDNHLLPYAG